MAKSYVHRKCGKGNRSLSDWEQLFQAQVESGESAHCPECGKSIADQDDLKLMRTKTDAPKFNSFEELKGSLIDSGMVIGHD